MVATATAEAAATTSCERFESDAGRLEREAAREHVGRLFHEHGALIRGDGGDAHLRSRVSALSADDKAA